MEYNKRNVIVERLINDSNQLLSDEKKKKINFDDDSNFLRVKLNHAGFGYEKAFYVFILISIGFGVLAATFINLVMSSPIIYTVSAIIFSMFPYIVLEKIIASRQEEFNFGLKGIIDKVVSMMKSGVGFEQALKKSILTSRSKFTKEIFEIYINEKDIIGEDKVFEKMFKLVESKELRIFYLVISIGRQSGGKFSNTLETLRKTLHDQGTIKNEITASTKEIRIGTYMIIALTIGIYMMMDNVFEGALNEHFFGSTEGQVQMFFIIVWVAFGIFVNNMISKIKG
jgi:tight adherence protein B